LELVLSLYFVLSVCLCFEICDFELLLLIVLIKALQNIKSQKPNNKQIPNFKDQITTFFDLYIGACLVIVFCYLRFF